MALHEAFDHQHRTATPVIVAEPPQDWSVEIPRLSSLREAVGLVLVTLLLAMWTVGAYAGIVYWSLQGSLWGVILSAVVPGFGAATTLPLYLWLGSTGSV